MWQPIGIIYRLLVGGGLLVFGAALEPPVTTLDEVIQTERTFAREALRQGLTRAFLDNMADSAIMQYKGRLQRAKPIWQSFPDLRDSLCWGPAFAGISRAGDLGYTHGPYYTVVKGQQTQAGHFVTVWQRQTSGRYQFVLDLGADSPAYPRPIPDRETRTTIRTTPVRGLTNAFARTHDQAFADALLKQTQPHLVYEAVLSTEVTLLRTDRPRAAGRGAARSQLRSDPTLRFTVTGGQVAQSGDVAYAYGTFEAVQPNQTATGLYARIWRHEAEGWRLLTEVLSYTHP